MKTGDTVRIKKTDIVGTITKVEGHHILVKSDVYSIPVMFYENELELITSASVIPTPCIICGHAHQVTNEGETEFAVYCTCGIAQIGETKEEAITNWNQLHATQRNRGERCVFDE